MNGLTATPSGVIGKPDKEGFPKKGETIKLVVDDWGHVNKFDDNNPINPRQRLIEVEVKSVKRVKVEFEEE